MIQEGVMNRRRGASPLLDGDATRVLVVLPRSVIAALDSYGRRNDLPSRSAVLRRAARELLAREGASE